MFRVNLMYIYVELNFLNSICENTLLLSCLDNEEKGLSKDG